MRLFPLKIIDCEDYELIQILRFTNKYHTIRLERMQRLSDTLLKVVQAHGAIVQKLVIDDIRITSANLTRFQTFLSLLPKVKEIYFCSADTIIVQRNSDLNDIVPVTLKELKKLVLNYTDWAVSLNYFE